jgi:hypothetical protein
MIRNIALAAIFIQVAATAALATQLVIHDPGPVRSATESAARAGIWHGDLQLPWIAGNVGRSDD